MKVSSQLISFFGKQIWKGLLGLERRNTNHYLVNVTNQDIYQIFLDFDYEVDLYRCTKFYPLKQFKMIAWINLSLQDKLVL